LNGSSKIIWIGALAVAGAAYWYASRASGGDAGGNAPGDTSGYAPDGGGLAPAATADSAPTQGLTDILQSIGRSLGIVTSKGIRNNNAGNLRYVAGIPWRGQLGDDGTGYAVFDSAEDGVRALGHQLSTYLARGLNTVQAIISTFAPDSENNTAAYVADVSQRIGADPGQALDRGAIPVLAQAIIIHENGTDPYGIASIAAWSTEA
jgi:hypothetical protein